MLDEIDPITGLPKKKRRLAYVFDYESGQFVETTEEEVAERERYYQRFRQVGPPGTPGKITPMQLEGNRQRVTSNPEEFLKELQNLSDSDMRLAVANIGATEEEADELVREISTSRPQAREDEIFRNVFPGMDKQAIIDTASENFPSFLQAVQKKGRTPDTEDLLKLLGYSDEELADVFAPSVSVGITPPELEGVAPGEEPSQSWFDTIRERLSRGRGGSLTAPLKDAIQKLDRKQGDNILLDFARWYAWPIELPSWVARIIGVKAGEISPGEVMENLEPVFMGVPPVGIILGGIGGGLEHLAKVAKLIEKMEKADLAALWKEAGLVGKVKPLNKMGEEEVKAMSAILEKQGKLALPKAAKAAVAKEPWQMTREEFAANPPSQVKSATQLREEYESILVPILRRTGADDPNSPIYRQAGQEAFAQLKKAHPELKSFADLEGMPHEAYIFKALREKQPVPPEVLKDYPELAKIVPGKAGEAIPKAEAGMPEGKMPVRLSRLLSKVAKEEDLVGTDLIVQAKKAYAEGDLAKLEELQQTRLSDWADDAIKDLESKAKAPYLAGKQPFVEGALPGVEGKAIPPEAAAKAPGVEAPLVKERPPVTPVELRNWRDMGLSSKDIEELKTMSAELRELHTHQARLTGFRDVSSEAVDDYLQKALALANKRGDAKAIDALERAIEYNDAGVLQNSILESEKGLGYLHLDEMSELRELRRVTQESLKFPAKGEVPPVAAEGAVPPEDAGLKNIREALFGGKPPTKPPSKPPPEIPEPSPSITPGPMAENIIGLRTIEPGLTRGQTLGNIAKRMVSKVTTRIGGRPMVEFEPMANAALTERARVRVALESKANVLGTKAETEINAAFKLDKKGGIESLKGIDTSLPGAPTIQDLAARLPLYEKALTAEQKTVMDSLKKAIQPYHDLLTEVGVELRHRADVMDGGFYLPRGKAALEGADEPLKISGGGRRAMRKGFEKPTVFASQAEGISKGYEYAPVAEALTSYAYDAGMRATDAHVANYFKALTDETGKFLGQTPKMRLMEQNPEIARQVNEANVLLDKLKRNIGALSQRQLDVIDLWQRDPEWADTSSLILSLQEGVTAMRGGTPPQVMVDLKDALDATKAVLQQLKPEYDRALRRATVTPREQGVIILPALAGRTFPDEIANAANIILKKEGETTGVLAPAVNVANAFNNLYRGLRATLDNSALGIQGLLGMYGEPKAYAEALKVNIKAWGIGGDKALGKFLTEFDSAANKVGRLPSDMWAKAGLRQGGATSEFAIGVGTKIGELPGVRQANRAFGYFGDALRLEWADNQLAGLLKSRTLEQIRKSGDLERIANAANVMTGWAAGKTFGSVGDLVLFAPRFLQSRLETVAKGVIGLRPGAPIDQQMARNSLLKMIGFGTMVTTGVNMAQGEETDFRLIVDGKRNPKFMRIKYADRYYSLFGTWDSLVAMMLNIGTGKPLQALRNQASGLTTAAFDLISGRDYDYKPTRDTPAHFAQWVLGSMIPFAAGELPQAVGEFGIGIKESDLAKTAAGGVQAVSVITGFKSFPGEDWNANALKLGLPKSDDPTLLSTENPPYLTSNYASDTLAQLRNTSPEEVAKNKDFPPRVKAISAAHELNKTVEGMPNQIVASIESNPVDKNGQPQDTFVEFYKQWQERQKITDETALKEFDKKYPQAEKGNMTQRQYVLMQQLNQRSANDNRGREQFIRDHFDEIGKNPRLEYFKAHPDENASLALWGQAKVYSAVAYEKVMKLAKELDIPDNALPDFGVPEDEETRKGYFEYQEAKDKFGTGQPETDLILAKNDKLREFLGLKSKITTPIPALEIGVKNRNFNDKYEVLTSEKERNAFLEVNPGYADDKARISAYKKQYAYDNTVADKKMVESFVEYDKTGAGNEKTLYRIDHPDFEAVWSKVEGWKPIDVKSVDALRLKVKNKAQTEAFGKLLTAEGRTTYLLDPINKEYALDTFRIKGFDAGIPKEQIEKYAKKEYKDTYFETLDATGQAAFLQADPAYHMERVTEKGTNAGVPDNYMPTYMKYELTPTEGQARERILQADPTYYHDVYLGILGQKPIDFTKVASEKFEVTYRDIYSKKPTDKEKDLFRYLNPDFEKEGLAIGKFEKAVLVKSVLAQRLAIANQALDEQYNRIVSPADQWAFLDARPQYKLSRIAIKGLNDGVPESFINEYVTWKATPMSRYALERFMSIHLSFYNQVYKKILAEDRLDFRNILSEALEVQLKTYTDLRGAKKTAYLKSHSALRRWMERRAKLRPSERTDMQP